MGLSASERERERERERKSEQHGFHLQRLHGDHGLSHRSALQHQQPRAPRVPVMYGQRVRGLDRRLCLTG